jgi:hypothetical protein
MYALLEIGIYPVSPCSSHLPISSQAYAHEIETYENPSFSEFSTFVFGHLTKKFGLESLVQQVSRDIMEAVETYQDKSSEVQLFGLFLSGVYDELDLMFYLLARSRLLSLLVAEMGAFAPLNLNISSLTISEKKHSSKAKQILAQQPDIVYHDFLTVLEGKWEPAVREEDSKMDVHLYLLLLVAVFHRFKSDNDGNETPSSPEAPQQSMHSPQDASLSSLTEKDTAPTPQTVEEHQQDERSAAYSGPNVETISAFQKAIKNLEKTIYEQEVGGDQNP